MVGGMHGSATTAEFQGRETGFGQCRVPRTTSSPPQVMSPTTSSSQRLMSSTPRSP